jgi:PBP1b-binding outer membrane lipoprotein LpoB
MLTKKPTLAGNVVLVMMTRISILFLAICLIFGCTGTDPKDTTKKPDTTKSATTIDSTQVKVPPTDTISH